MSLSTPTADFSGFPKGTLAFFEQLAQNNNREWFAENKPVYQREVVEPLQGFIMALAPRLKKISPHFDANPSLRGGSIFRIYRDVRFSADKRPYKENAGCHIRHHSGRSAHAPGFYFHLAPDSIFLGAGIWRPGSEELFKIRTAIVESGEQWSAVKRNTRFRKTFTDLDDGDRLKRPPSGFAKDHPHIEDLKRKSFVVINRVNKSATRNSGIVDLAADTFASSMPLIRFLCSALDLPA